MKKQVIMTLSEFNQLEKTAELLAKEYKKLVEEIDEILGPPELGGDIDLEDLEYSLYTIGARIEDLGTLLGLSSEDPMWESLVKDLKNTNFPIYGI